MEHLRMDLTQKQKPNTTIAAIAFQQPAYLEWIRSGRPVDVCYTVVENHYRGKTTPQLRIKDIKIVRCDRAGRDRPADGTGAALRNMFAGPLLQILRYGCPQLPVSQLLFSYRYDVRHYRPPGRVSSPRYGR